LSAEQEDLLREMGQQAAKPTPEVALLRQQVDQLQSRHRTELALIEHERLQLQQRLQDEVFMFLHTGRECLHSVLFVMSFVCERWTCNNFAALWIIRVSE